MNTDKEVPQEFYESKIFSWAKYYPQFRKKHGLVIHEKIREVISSNSPAIRPFRFNIGDIETLSETHPKIYRDLERRALFRGLRFR